jgi:hypothetical protein
MKWCPLTFIGDMPARCCEEACAWWDEAIGECAVVPKWTTLTTQEATDE